MRFIFTLLAFMALVLPVSAQRNRNQVNLTVVGNKDLRLLVDGRDQALANTVITGNSSSGNLERINSGQHTLQISRTNPNTNRLEQVNTNFLIRRGFDLDITITANGSIEMIESRGGSDYNDNPAMSTVNFNNLLRTVRAQRTPQLRYTYVANSLNNTDYAFTVSQIDQLMQLIDGETNRIVLVKQAYRNIIDRENYYLLYYMFSASNKNELYDYVDYYESRGGGYGGGGNGGGGYGDGGKHEMSEQEFTTLLNDIKQQWPPSSQENSIADAFNNTAKYYSVGQAVQLIQLINSDASRLRLAKLSYRGIVDRNNFYQVVDLLVFQSNKDQLNTYVSNYKDAPDNNNNIYNYAMSETDYNRLYQTVKAEWPPTAQANSVKAAFNNLNYFFTAAQVSKLLRLFTFEDDKLDLAKAAYRGIVDRNNIGQVYDVFSFQMTKDKYTNFISSYKDNNSGRAIVSDSKFNEIRQSIQSKIFPGEKMSALQDLFNDNRYLYYSNQARQLIEMVSLESNRLTLAKLVYRHIADRNNFRQVIELLYNQNNRTQLEDYIRTYRD